jgi:hypothetical protein
MKKLLLLLLFPTAVFAAQNDLRFLQENNAGKFLEITESPASFRSRLGLGAAATSNATDFVASTNGTATNLTISGNASAVNLSSCSAAFPLTLPASTVIQGLVWANSGNQTTLGYETVQHKLRVTSKKRIDLLPAQDYQGDGFIQLGNDGGTAEYVFVSKEGEASASYPNVPSHRFNLNSASWNGTASVAKVVTMQADTDSAGDPVLQVFIPGSSGAGTYNGTLSRYTYNSGNMSLVLTKAGLNGLRSGSLPAYSFITSNTTGLGCNTTGEWYLTRNGTAQLTSSANGVVSASSVFAPSDNQPRFTGNGTTSGLGFNGSDFVMFRAGTAYFTSDSFYGTVFQTALTSNVRVQLAAGSVNFNSLCRTDKTDTGLYFPTTGAVGISSNGTEQARFATTGPILQIPATAPSLTANSSMTFELTNNTTLTIKVRGTDGTTRSTTLTLAP